MSLGGAGARPYRFRLTAGFFAHLFKAVFRQHHRALEPVLRGLLAADAVVIDVGAHAGQFTKLFARLAPEGFVYAVEPGSYARIILRAALALNRVRNAAIVPLAVGARSGAALLSVPVKASGSYGFGLAHLGAERARAAEVEIVGVTTLDALADALGLDRVDFIKADIEGLELELVEGAQAVLSRFRPALLLEVDPVRLERAGASANSLWRALEALGYRAHAATEAAPPLDAPCGGDMLFLCRRT